MKKLYRLIMNWITPKVEKPSAATKVQRTAKKVKLSKLKIVKQCTIIKAIKHNEKV